MKRAELSYLTKIIVASVFLIIVSIAIVPKANTYWKGISNTWSNIINSDSNRNNADNTAILALKETVDSINNCAISSNDRCVCNLKFNLKNSDYGIKFQGQEALVIDSFGNPVGKIPKQAIKTAPCYWWLRDEYHAYFSKVTTPFSIRANGQNSIVIESEKGLTQISPYLIREKGEVCFYNQAYESYFRKYWETEEYKNNQFGLPWC